MTCNHCDAPCRLRWVTFANATRHIETRCRGCGRHNGYAAQTPENVAGADAAGRDEPPAPGLFDNCPAD